MYKIFMYEYSQSTNTLEYNPLTIYDDESSDLNKKLISPNLTLEDNKAGSLTFTMPVNNVGYDYVKVFKSTFVVKRKSRILHHSYRKITANGALELSRIGSNGKKVSDNRYLTFYCQVIAGVLYKVTAMKNNRMICYSSSNGVTYTETTRIPNADVNTRGYNELEFTAQGAYLAVTIEYKSSGMQERYLRDSVEEILFDNIGEPLESLNDYDFCLIESLDGTFDEPVYVEEIKTIWEGRAVSESRNFFNQKAITCEGALAYLNDMHVLKWDKLEQRPHTSHYPGYDATYNDKSIQFMAIFKYLLKYVNSDLTADEYYGSGLNTIHYTTQIIRTYDRRIFENDAFIVKYYGNGILDFSSDHQNMLDYICNSIVERHGGHIKLVRSAPITSADSDNMSVDPLDQSSNPEKSGLYIQYTEEYYTPDISTDMTKAYSAGDHVIQNGKVYRFISSHSANTPFALSEVEEVPDVKVSKIEFQKNLINLVRETDGSDCATAVLVLGGSYDINWNLQSFSVWDGYNSLDQSEQNHNKWLKSNSSNISMVDHQADSSVLQNFPTIPGFAIACPTVVLGFPDESEDRVERKLYYVVNVPSALKYGFIAAQMSSNESIVKNDSESSFSTGSRRDYNASAMLYRAGVEYLKEHDPDHYSVDVTAMDFNFVDPSVPYANVGDLFYTDSPIHGMDDSVYFILTKLSIPLDSPESTTFTLNRQVGKSLSLYIK